jgi:hypothetical protein
MNRLNVETRKLQPMMSIVLAVIMVPLGVLSIVMGLSGGVEPVPLGIGVMMLGTYGAVTALSRRGRSRSVKFFSEQGLERNDGRWLSWAELERVVHQVRDVSGQKHLWRTEIRFAGGEAAWLIPLRVGNLGEVSEFVRRLPCEHAEEKV